MKPNISRHIDDCLLTGRAKNIRSIIIFLNGFHCKIHYLASEDHALNGYQSAASDGRVSVWRHEVEDPGAMRLSDIVAIEAELVPVLGRVIAGTAHVWTGEAHVASLTDDARLAHGEVETVLAGFTEAPAGRDGAGQDTSLPAHVVLDGDWKARVTPHRESVEAGSTVSARAGVGDGDRPVVSVIVGVYNKAPFIQECLESVHAQGVDDVEIICIDDASTDGSFDAVAAVAHADPRIRLIRNERNLGAGQTRNVGLAMATGTYVMFLDADDLLAPRALPLLLAEAAATNADLVRGGIAFYSAGAEVSLRAVDTPPDRRGYRLADEPHLWIPWWFTTFLFRRSFLHSHRIDFPELKDGEDPIFLARALTAAESISSISSIVYYYRKHGGHKRNNNDFLAHLLTVQDVFDGYDPRVWKDGYGLYVMVHDLPSRLQRARPQEARDKLREAIFSLGIFPQRLLHQMLDEIA